MAKNSDRLARLQPLRHTPTKSQNGRHCPVIPHFHGKTDTTQLSGTRQVGQMVDTLLKEGVIVRSPEATPSFFIPKNTWSRLPFTMFHSYLHRFLVRGPHKFPTLHQIITSISASASCFACMDIKDGIFRSSSVQSCQTFILPAELKKMAGKFKSREIDR